MHQAKRRLLFVLCVSINLFTTASAASDTQCGYAPSTYKNAQDLVTKTLLHGISGAIAQTISSMMVDSLRALFRELYAYGALLGALGNRGFNHLCRRPEPFDAAQLRLFLHLVEDQLNSLTEQPLSEAIIFKNMHVEQDQTQSLELQQEWAFSVTRLNELFEYIVSWLNVHLAYYYVTPDQRVWLAKCAWNCSSTQRESIIFLAQMLIKHLTHIAAMSKTAKSIDDIDVAHVKKVGRATLLYLKKLIQLVGGNAQDTLAFQPYTNGINNTPNLVTI